MRALAVTAALWAGAAQATLPPCSYDAMVRDASLVIQVRVEEVSMRPGGLSCTVRGPVLTVLRDDGRIAVGQRAAFELPCLGEGSTPYPGPDIYREATTIAATPVIEYHGLSGGGVAGHGAGAVLLDAPTETIAWQPECGT